MKRNQYNRRSFLKSTALGLTWLVGCRSDGLDPALLGGVHTKPNLLFVFADQWRAQDMGYAGNPDILTPNFDRLADQSVNFVNAVSCCPVCSPFRASLITGQYPLTHGVFLNDLRLNNNAVSIAQVYRQAGYHTGYIGKWHLDGTGRSAFIPPERHQGFGYWKVLECTHNYNHSEYYEGADAQKRIWPGYDAIAQTQDAQNYLKARSDDQQPFMLFLSWGPPHAPYRTGPSVLLAQYDKKPLTLRKNVPEASKEKAIRDTAGYYAHCTALDQCMGELLHTLTETGLDRNTLVVFTSDHGDMLYSRGELKKQRPYDESIRIPFLVRCPTEWKVAPRQIKMPINSPDIMPTLLGLSCLPVPASVEGENLAKVISGGQPDSDRAVLIMCASPFGQWTRDQGGKEYRGIRTARYTYVKDLDGDWLLYDNEIDPWQQQNQIHNPAYRTVKQELASQLQVLLDRTGDEFLSGPELIRRCGYRVDKKETINYQDQSSYGQVSVCCRKG